MRILALLRQMEAEGYDARQIGMSLILPQMGKKMRGKQRKLSVSEKVKQQVRSAFLMRKAKAKAKGQGKAKAKAQAKVSPEDSVELEEAAEPEEQWEDPSANLNPVQKLPPLFPGG